MNAIQYFAGELRKWWSFDDRQHHTHSWHSREDFIERMLPALLSVDWLPIETAPTDGTDILLAAWNSHDAPGGPYTDYVVAAWDVEECGGENGWSTDHGLEPIDFDPTHWMPLPSPPPMDGKKKTVRHSSTVSAERTKQNTD